MKIKTIISILILISSGFILVASAHPPTRPSVEISYDSQIRMAQEAAENSKPSMALRHFVDALKLSDADQAKRRVAIFGIARMDLWLKRCKAAEKHFQLLLSTPLSREDRKLAREGIDQAIRCQSENRFKRANEYLEKGEYKKSLAIYQELLKEKRDPLGHELALNGYVRSLTALDRPREAYRSIPKNYEYKTSTFVVGASQAALGAGWPYYSENILQDNKVLLEQIPKGEGYLYRQWQDIDWQTHYLMSPNTLNYNNYFEGDSDDFEIQRHELAYSHLFSKKIQTSILYDHNNYSAPGFSNVSANNIGLQGEGWLNDEVAYIANLTEGNYSSDWHPFFWLGSLTYKPNDYLAFTVSNTKQAVESMQSLMDHVSFISTAINGTFFPITRLVITATYYNDQFSDENVRNGYYTDVSYLLFPDLGLFGDLMVRGYGNSKDTGNYFSPNNYFQTIFSLKLYRRLMNTTWRYYISAGIGGQKISDDDLTQTHAVSVGMNGPIYKYFVLDGYFAYTNTPGPADVTNTSFSRTFGGINISYLFG